MKIALIDTGISEKEINSEYKIRHFSLDNNSLVEVYKEPLQDHGTNCFKEIVSCAKRTDLEFIDYNILDENESIKVGNMIDAIEKAIEERVDIMNISLGIANYSEKLFAVCKKAIAYNIVILSAASHTNTVSFPADFKNVICVNVDQSQTEKIKTVDESTVSIAMRDMIVEEDGQSFDFGSSSYACARVCGYFSDALGENEIMDKLHILSKKYNLHLSTSTESDSVHEVKESEIQDILASNRAAVVVFPSRLINEVHKDCIHENVVAYYDHDKKEFIGYKDGKTTKEFDVIIIIGTSFFDTEGVERILAEQYKGYKLMTFGNFVNKNDNQCLYNYTDFEANSLSVLERPVIVIASICNGLNKTEVQLSLLESFKRDNLTMELVTNNPLGLILGGDVFNFPYEIKFPNIVFSINKYMYLEEVKKEFDAWLINIGGGLGELNNLNTCNFGKLPDAYFSAANIDIAILCVNPSVDTETLKLHLANFYKHSVQKVLIVVSHNEIDATTMDYRDGLQTIYIDDIKYQSALAEIRENMDEPVFSLDDVKNGVVYQCIIDALT